MGFFKHAFKKIGKKVTHSVKKIGKKVAHNAVSLGKKAGSIAHGVQIGARMISHTAQKAGGVVKVVGEITGQPELIAGGEALSKAGDVGLASSHALGAARKGKLEKAVVSTAEAVRGGQELQEMKKKHDKSKKKK